MNLFLKEIDERYSGLSDKNCCLSCGKAIEFIELNKNDICIDLGCGKGYDVFRMAENTQFAYGIDISEKMIANAKAEATLRGIKNVRFLHTDLEKIPLNNGIANHIISNCVLNHARNKQAVWNEIYRILCPNGDFSISDIYSTSPVPEKYANDPVAISECWAGAVTKEKYLEHIHNAGFSEPSIVEESIPYNKGNIEVVSFTIKAIKQ